MTPARQEANLGRAPLWTRRLKSGPAVERPVAGGEPRATRRPLAKRLPHAGRARLSHFD